MPDSGFPEKHESDSDGHGSDQQPETTLITAGRRDDWTGTPSQPGRVVSPPVWRASTHLYPDMAALRAEPKYNTDGRFYYGRRGAPTQWALADALTTLEPGAFGTILYPSGVSAIASVLLALLRPGDVLVMTDNAYEPSRTLARTLLADYSIETRWYAPGDIASFAAAICPRTRVALVESPGSLTMEVEDIPALAAVARAAGIVTVLDNTWASPLGFATLAHGIDINVMSLTKHIGGHSDLMMGSASAGEALYQKLRRSAQITGIVVSPDDAALALRGLRTMGVRVRRESDSALAVAQFLATRPEIAHVLCPMLPGAPGYALWARDFTGGCGLFSFVFAGGTARARDAFIDALSLFGIGYSWGGFESLATPVDPASMRSATPWPPEGWAENDRFGVRLSIGLEDPVDLIADVERALKVWTGA